MKKLLVCIAIVGVFYGCKDNNVSSTSGISVNETDTSLSDNDTYAPNPEGVELTQSELDMIIAVNKYRVQYGRRILKVSKKLMDEARTKVKAMIPYTAQYSSTEQWMHSLTPHSGSENIFLGPRSVESAMSGFKTSSAHNGNMLSSSHTYIGVGVEFSNNAGKGCFAQNMQ